jgi:hypothetical protein
VITEGGEQVTIRGQSPPAYDPYANPGAAYPTTMPGSSGYFRQPQPVSGGAVPTATYPPATYGTGQYGAGGVAQPPPTQT